jgi:hypothetical protein
MAGDRKSAREETLLVSASFSDGIEVPGYFRVSLRAFPGKKYAETPQNHE